MKDAIKIQLTKGNIAILDRGDAHLSEWKWFFHGGYAMRNTSRRDNQEGKQINIFLHHAIMGRPLNGLQINHINGNSLDNRRENLRIVTNRQNTQNQKCHRTGKKSSKFIGVYWNKKMNKWTAMIYDKNRNRYIGSFSREIDASMAYQNCLRKV